MFILRKISGKGVEMNISLGSGYTLITEERNPEEFKPALGSYCGDVINTDIFAFVTGDDGQLLPISIKQQTYIMTESGKTFSRIFNNRIS